MYEEAHIIQFKISAPKMFYILKHSFTSLSLIIMPSETDVAPGWVGWDGLGRKSLGGASYA